MDIGESRTRKYHYLASSQHILLSVVPKNCISPEIYFFDFFMVVTFIFLHIRRHSQTFRLVDIFSKEEEKTSCKRMNNGVVQRNEI